jgi:site-specific recombinase XerC
LIVVLQTNQWQRLRALVLDSVSSPITKRVYNLGLDELIAWYGQEPRPGFTKATVSAWRVALEARGLSAVSINVRITAVRELAAEAADNGCWRRNWQPASRASKARRRWECAPGTGCR